MKHIFFLSLAALTTTAAIAQNTAVINQQGGAHEVSVVQQGSGNTSVVNQSTGQTANRASVTQSGAGNVATINQGTGSDSAAGSTNSVNTTQSGEGETIINQTKDGNSISVYQSGGTATDPKKKGTAKKKVKQ